MARFEPGFRWCLTVLSPSPGGCRSGCARARLRPVFCPRAGACFFSFEPGFRWCLAVLSLLPGGCRSGCVRARLRPVFCPRAGPVSSPLGVSDLSLRHAAGEGFWLGLSPDLGGVWLF